MTELEFEKELLKDFVLHEKCSAEQIEKYRGKVPGFLIDIWENYGLGTFRNGYLRTIDPDEYTELLNETYYAAERSIPIFATAFGDIITFQEQEYMFIVKYRRGDFEGLDTSEKYFVQDFSNDEYAEEYFDYEQYPAAVKKLGIPPYDQCFCYVPILGMGGSEKVDNIELGDLKTHIQVITHFMGPI